MFVLDEKLFEAGLKIFQIPIEWFRQVSRFLNQLCGGTGIRVSRPSVPSSNAPVEISIDEEWLDKKIEGPATTSYATPATATASSQPEYLPGGSSAVSGLALQTDSFSRGGSNGYKFPVFTRIYYQSGSYAFLVWREVKIGKGGHIDSVSEEKGVRRIRIA